MALQRESLLSLPPSHLATTTPETLLTPKLQALVVPHPQIWALPQSVASETQFPSVHIKTYNFPGKGFEGLNDKAHIELGCILFPSHH